MFTGIVADIGRIESMVSQGDGARMRVVPQALAVDDVAIGDSIAVNGCCLTVVDNDPSSRALAFDVSGETLRCTTGFAPASAVNLEKALRLVDRLGGHLVTGHVDGVGVVCAFEPVQGGTSESSWRVVIEVPPELSRFLAAKGSIAVDGVSLTINKVNANTCEVNLIPHTLQVTTLRWLAPGARVNIEVDLMARYAARLAGW
ncbi:MAG TPA: riboflavin synthase [Burkholderiales bacterium]|nr:riboflavin synthase [Burkholderiales bacterium]